MAKKQDKARIQKHALTASNAEELFSTVDETGHTNAETAKKQRIRRRMFGSTVAVDPLSREDPSGSNVERVITLTAVSFVLVFFALVIVGQVGIGYIRRVSTANLANEVSVKAVGSAMSGGVEWGNGFTQFPEHFSVQEADENTHRIEVTVVDTTSKELIEVFAGSQIQASALAVNALLNPKVNQVIYHVNVYFDEKGKLAPAQLFGLLPPSGVQKTLMTFEWQKVQTEEGVRFKCTISGLDSGTQAQLRSAIASSFTPSDILGKVLGSSSSSAAAGAGDGAAGDGAGAGAGSGANKGAGSGSAGNGAGSSSDSSSNGGDAANGANSGSNTGSGSASGSASGDKNANTGGDNANAAGNGGHAAEPKGSTVAEDNSNNV